MERTKLLWIGDYSNTGFGTVAKGLLRGLAATGKYEILQLGINYSEILEFDEPWQITPAGWWHINDKGEMVAEDAYGAIKADVWVERFDPDIVVINNDYPIARLYLETAKKKEPTRLAQHRSLKVIYAPIDSEPVPKHYIDIAKMFDLNIAYTYWQRDLMAKHDPIFQLMPVLYHGYDELSLYPMDKAEAKRQLSQVFAKYNDGTETDFTDKWIVHFVGANQFRKDLPCLFRAFSLFVDDAPEAFLLPQTNAFPKGNNGWSLANLQVLTEVKNAVIMEQANIFTAEEQRILYNAADVLAYPTRGEGFGLPSFEAMACKTPVIATQFGPQAEIHRDGRGYFIDIRDVIPGDIFAWSYFVLPDHRSLYQQLKFVHDNPEHVAETVQKAYDYVKPFSWHNQAMQLDKILSRLPAKE